MLVDLLADKESSKIVNVPVVVDILTASSKALVPL